MTLKFTFRIVLLAFLGGCSSAAEKQALYEVSEFYSGNVNMTKGSNFSTNGEEPQGHYLAVTLNSPGLSRHYSTPQLPASNCAYLVFSNLTPPEREEYDYLKVTVSDSGSTHTYTYQKPQLQQALTAATNLRTLIFNIQSKEYSAAAANFNPAALGTLPHDSVSSILRTIGRRLNPFTEYRLHGFNLENFPIKGRPQQLVRLYISVPRQPEPDHFLTAVINPKLSDTQQFLYGLDMAK
jgi:hypothetical protein